MTPTAIVTGGLGGIGRAIADRLAADGLLVLAADVTVPEGATVHSGAAAGSVVPVPMDVASTASVERAVGAAASAGPLRVVVNCAGILRPNPLSDLRDETLALVLEVNLAGAFRVIRASLPYLASGSSVVNIGSIAARAGSAPGVALYAATKAALEGLTYGLACELGPRGIRVNTVAPGFVNAPMSAMLRSAGDERLLRQVPLGRFAEPSDIAEAVAFLASERASYITGAVIPVDGGALAR